MRSAGVLALALLAGCGQSEPANVASSEMAEVTAVPSPSPTSPPEPSATLAISGVIHPSAPLVPPPPGSGRHFQALGTEPFWSFDVSAEKLVFSSPEAINGVTLKAKVAVNGKVYRYSGVMDGKPLVLVIKPSPCSDGMSDTSYAFAATYTLGTQTENGCARAK